MITDTILKLLKLDKLAAQITGYVEARIDLIKHDIRRQAAANISKFIVLLIALLTACAFLLFMSIALAIYLGRIYGWETGFICVGVIYLIVLIVLILMKKPLLGFIEKQFNDILDNENHEPSTD